MHRRCLKVTARVHLTVNGLRINLPSGGMLKEQEAGLPAAEICRKHGVR